MYTLFISKYPSTGIKNHIEIILLLRVFHFKNIKDIWKSN